MAGGDRNPHPSSASNSHRKRKAATYDSGRENVRVDIVTLLRGAIEFKNRTGAAPTPASMNAFYETVKGKLRSPFPEDKVYNKFRRLRHNLSQAASSGRAGDDDDLVLKLSAELWSHDKEKKDKKVKKDDRKEKELKEPKKKEGKKDSKKEEEAKKEKSDALFSRDDSGTEMEDNDDEDDEEDKKVKKDTKIEEDKKKKLTLLASHDDNDAETEEEEDDDDEEEEEEEEKKKQVKVEEEEEKDQDEDDDDEDEDDNEGDADEKEKDEKKDRVKEGEVKRARGGEYQDMKKEKDGKIKEMKEQKERGATPESYPYVIHGAAEYWRAHGLSNVSLEEAWKSVDRSKARVLEEKWKKHFNEELRLQVDWGKLHREILELLTQTHKSVTQQD